MAIKIIHDSLPAKRTKLFQNLLGKKYGHWTVTEYVGKTINGTGRWLCHCGLCGDYKIVDTSSLNRGNSNSCGCERDQLFVKQSTVHGMFGTIEYGTWSGMKQRCYNENCHSYKNYGGRGILMCRQWKDSFTKFFDDMGIRPDDKSSLDRIDNNKGYSPDNCRWSTQIEQSNNKRTNTLTVYKGKIYTISELSKEIMIPYNSCLIRINKGQSISKIITEYKPRRKKA